MADLLGTNRPAPSEERTIEEEADRLDALVLVDTTPAPRFNGEVMRGFGLTSSDVAARFSFESPTPEAPALDGQFGTHVFTKRSRRT